MLLLGSLLSYPGLRKAKMLRLQISYTYKYFYRKEQQYYWKRRGEGQETAKMSPVLKVIC